MAAKKQPAPAGEPAEPTGGTAPDEPAAPAPTKADGEAVAAAANSAREKIADDEIQGISESTAHAILENLKVLTQSGTERASAAVRKRRWMPF